MISKEIEVKTILSKSQIYEYALNAYVGCQPLEAKYKLTKGCLEILVDNGWLVAVQTKSPLVLRDREILTRAVDAEVGFTVATADEKVRGIFEPGAPSIAKRAEALRILHSEGIKTFVMVAPLLPGADGLAGMLKGRVDRALIDRYNYHYADRAYKEHGMEWARDDGFFRRKGEELRAAFERAGVPCRKL